jgi:hypothetical protein
MLQRVNWPPNYAQIKRDRAVRLRVLHQDLKAQAGAKVFYANGFEGCVAFIEDWCETFDPRNAGTGRPTTMPFVLFPRQREFVEFLYACYFDEADGLVEKSRDMGATWLCACFSVWLFLFVPGATIGWGSQDGGQVDKLGDMSSIFEKMRFELRSIPRIFWPKGFDETCMNLMRIYEPAGNSITGECGDDIGRGGRTRVYMKDESAHYLHPEMIEAALGDNTRVQIDISSVNGLGNVFHRKREAGIEWAPGQPAVKGKTNVFVFDWSDHPEKTQAWFDRRREKAISDGLLHKFNQEVTRDYAASVVGVIIPAEWVAAAIDAHVKLGFETGRGWHAGLDVADEGGDTNALVARRGILAKHCEEWGAPNTGETTRKAIGIIETLVPVNSKGRRPCRVYYDSIGVGSGVKSEVNRLEQKEEGADASLMPLGIKFYSWNAGAKVQDPDDTVVETDDGEAVTNKDFFMNLKAQAWWSARRRFEKTYECIKAGKLLYPVDELISIPSDLPNLRTLQKELSQPVSKKSATMKMMVDKAPTSSAGKKGATPVKSPNKADAFIMCYFPVEQMSYDASLDWV